MQHSHNTTHTFGVSFFSRKVATTAPKPGLEGGVCLCRPKLSDPINPPYFYPLIQPPAELFFEQFPFEDPIRSESFSARAPANRALGTKSIAVGSAHGRGVHSSTTLEGPHRHGECDPSRVAEFALASRWRCHRLMNSALSGLLERPLTANRSPHDECDARASWRHRERAVGPRSQAYRYNGATFP